MEAQTKKIHETFNNEPEDLKNKQNWTVTAMKNTVEGINRMNEAAEWSEWADLFWFFVFLLVDFIPSWKVK